MPFPNEYADLLSLPKLNEATLKPKRVNRFRVRFNTLIQKVWELLFSRPSEVDEIVKKQVLLVCLNFAQSKILESIPIFEGASLSHVSTKPIRFDYLKYNFNLKFASESNASVRVGSHLLFAFNGNPNVVSYFNDEGYSCFFRHCASLKSIRILWSSLLTSDTVLFLKTKRNTGIFEICLPDQR